MMTTLAWVILPIEKRPFLRLRARVQQTGSRCSMQSALADCRNLAADRALTRNAALSRRPAGTTGLKACAGWRDGPETVCRCHNLLVPSSYARYADQNATGLLSLWGFYVTALSNNVSRESQTSLKLR